MHCIPLHKFATATLFLPHTYTHTPEIATTSSSETYFSDDTQHLVDSATDRDTYGESPAALLMSRCMWLLGPCSNPDRQPKNTAKLLQPAAGAAREREPE